MDDQELSSVEEYLRAALGQKAIWRRHDRGSRSPMNFFLDRAEQHLGTPVEVFWMENAAPSVFCLGEFSRPVVAFSPRYIELWADVRSLFVDNTCGPELKTALIEKLCLRLIAELSMSGDDPEFAAITMLRSSLLSSNLYRVPNTIETLEHEPLAPPYMACWFYGTAHELGHFKELPDDEVPRLFDDDNMAKLVESVLKLFGSLPDTLRQKALARSRREPADWFLGVDTLRREGTADIFATSLLFESTLDIMLLRSSETDAPSFDLASFLSEMLISLNVMTVIERCRRMARIASTGTPLEEVRTDAILHPAAVAVRMQMVRWYLESASARYIHGKDATAEQESAATNLVDAVAEELRTDVELFERGLANALVFALDRRRRSTFVEDIQTWREAVLEDADAGTLIIAEVREFLSRAAALGKGSPLFDAMAGAAQDPRADVMPDVSGQAAYLCAWVKGPGGANGPFGLPTRHGRVVFLFAFGARELFDKYSATSAETLDDGFEMQSLIIVGDSEAKLHDAIAQHLPIGAQFVLAVQGTDLFDRLIAELSDGTIWPEPG